MTKEIRTQKGLAMDKEEAEAMTKVWEALPPIQRRAIIWWIAHRMEIKEIAEGLKRHELITPLELKSISAESIAEKAIDSAYEAFRSIGKTRTDLEECKDDRTCPRLVQAIMISRPNIGFAYYVRREGRVVRLKEQTKQESAKPPIKITAEVKKREPVAV